MRLIFRGRLTRSEGPGPSGRSRRSRRATPVTITVLPTRTPQAGLEAGTLAGSAMTVPLVLPLPVWLLHFLFSLAVLAYSTHWQC